MELEFDDRGNFIKAETSTKDGARLVVRPAAAEDKPLLERMFMTCNSETLYTRFLSPGVGVPIRYLDRLMKNDPPGVRSLLAEAAGDQDPKVVGLVNYVETDPGVKGEIAIIVHDYYQNRGLGTAMINVMIELARRGGAKCLVADIDAGNRRVFYLIQKSGLPSKVTIDQGVAHAEVDVSAN